MWHLMANAHIAIALGLTQSVVIPPAVAQASDLPEPFVSPHQYMSYTMMDGNPGSINLAKRLAKSKAKEARP